MRQTAKLTEIQNAKAVTKDTAPEFLFEYQRSILLALTEQGILNETQYRYAEDKLTDQFRSHAKKKAQKGGNPA